MVVDFGGCWLIEVACKYLFADMQPKAMIVRGRERREERRTVQAVVEQREQAERERREAEEKAQAERESEKGALKERTANGARRVKS